MGNLVSIRFHSLVGEVHIASFLFLPEFSYSKYNKHIFSKDMFSDLTRTKVGKILGGGEGGRERGVGQEDKKNTFNSKTKFL